MVILYVMKQLFAEALSANKLFADMKKCLQEEATGQKLFAQTSTQKKLFVLKKFSSPSPRPPNKQ